MSYTGCPEHNINNGTVTIFGSEEFILAIYDCDKGYNLIGMEISVCLENYTWSGREPICQSKLSIFMNY